MKTFVRFVTFLTILAAASLGIAQDQTKSQQVTIDVVSATTITLTCPATFPSAKIIAGVGVPYKNADGTPVQCVASGGTVPYKWTVTTPLPAGLTLTGSGTNNANGVIGGTPTVVAAKQTATIQVTDSSGALASVVLKWNRSTSTVVTYNILRGSAAGGPYSPIGTVADPVTTFTDKVTRLPVRTLYYIATATDANGQTSVASNEVGAAIK